MAIGMTLFDFGEEKVFGGIFIASTEDKTFTKTRYKIWIVRRFTAA